MEKDFESKKVISRQATWKILVFILVITGAALVFQKTSFRSFLTSEAISDLLRSFGWWAPVVFILVEAISICLFTPAIVPIILASAIFGSYLGFLCAWAGALAGASGAFLIGRALGRDFVTLIMGKRLRRCNDTISRNGFATVLYLRLLNTPFTTMSYAFSLTDICFKEYFFGTALGVMTPIFVITFLGGTLKYVWVSGMWGELISLKVFFATGILVFSLLIPVIIKKAKGQTENIT